MFKQVKTITVPEKKKTRFVFIARDLSAELLTRDKTANLGILKAERVPGQVPGTF